MNKVVNKLIPSMGQNSQANQGQIGPSTDLDKMFSLTRGYNCFPMRFVWIPENHLVSSLWSRF